LNALATLNEARRDELYNSPSKDLARGIMYRRFESLNHLSLRNEVPQIPQDEFCSASRQALVQEVAAVNTLMQRKRKKALRKEDIK